MVFLIASEGDATCPIMAPPVINAGVAVVMRPASFTASVMGVPTGTRAVMGRSTSPAIVTHFFVTGTLCSRALYML